MSRKKIWELSHQIACKIIGMAFDSRELRKVANKFQIAFQGPLADDEFTLHSGMVSFCENENRVSRQLQNLIESKFYKYSARLNKMQYSDLLESVEHAGAENSSIPLWAYLWEISVRDQSDAATQTVLFGHLHMLEHTLLKEFWRSGSEAKVSQQSKESNWAPVLQQLLAVKQELKRDCQLTERVIDELSQIRRPSQVTPNLSESMAQENLRLTVKNKDLTNLLEQSRSERNRLENECARLRMELRLFTEDISRFSMEAAAQGDFPDACSSCENLKGKHIAMVGGIESLECHYRTLVEQMGATFHLHNGNCGAGECPIEDCIKKADLVVCPISVNSHGAIKAAKRLCRKLNVPCYFARTAGVNGLRTALHEYIGNLPAA